MNITTLIESVNFEQFILKPFTTVYSFTKRNRPSQYLNYAFKHRDHVRSGRNYSLNLTVVSATSSSLVLMPAGGDPTNL